MENKLKNYTASQMEDPDFLQAWEEAEACYQAARILLKIREEKHLSQAEMARLAGKKQSYIARVETGGQNISVQTLSEIAEAAGGKLRLEVIV